MKEILINEINDVKNQLKYLNEKENDLVKTLIDYRLSSFWDKNDKSIYKEIERAICYLEQRPKLYLNVTNKKYYNYKFNKFDLKDSVYEASTIEYNDNRYYECSKFKDISLLIEWKNAFKNYINDNPKIFSLEEWKKSLSLDIMWKILNKQEEVYLINHPKIKVKNIVIIKKYPIN